MFSPISGVSLFFVGVLVSVWMHMCVSFWVVIHSPMARKLLPLSVCIFLLLGRICDLLPVTVSWWVRTATSLVSNQPFRPESLAEVAEETARGLQGQLFELCTSSYGSHVARMFLRFLASNRTTMPNVGDLVSPSLFVFLGRAGCS